MISKADKSEELATELKELLKSIKDNKELLLNVNKLFKSKEIDVKRLELQMPETLTEIIDYIKSQSK